MCVSISQLLAESLPRGSGDFYPGNHLGFLVIPCPGQGREPREWVEKPVGREGEEPQ